VIGNYKNQLITLGNWLIVALIALLWIRFALHDDSPNNLQATSGIKPTSSYLPAQQKNSISQYHIFGSSQELIDIPISTGETKLNLELSGTMSNINNTQGLAYISNAQGVQKKFIVGDKVFNTATLKEIHKTYVVLQHHGKKERLSLRENKQTTRGNRKSKNNQQAPAYLKHLNGGQSNDWQATMDKQKFNPATISKLVKKVNFVADQKGDIQGIRVSGLVSGDLLTKSGLQPNDIITAINGNRVSSENILKIKQTLEQNPNATISIKRNGRVQNVQVNLNKF
jgi:type II secretion system protein C